MNTLQTFQFEEQEIRTQVINNEPWFVGKDVADVLGYKNGSRDINRHVEGVETSIDMSRKKIS